jgi:FkbM family methyltransferase
MNKRRGYFLELSWLLFIKLTGRFIPKRLRFRFFKFFYNYQSSRCKGVKLVIPYYPSLNLQILVHTNYLIDWNVFFFGYYEKETNDLLFQYIQPGQVVIEAGANNGTETLLLSKIVGEQGKVYAFEPIQHINDTLKINLSLNTCTNVSTETLALGESDKDVIFRVRPLDFCNQGMASQDHTSDAHTEVVIKQVAIDSWIKDKTIVRIDFLKMDIQGAEINLLKGAQNTIKKFRPLIFTEATTDFLSLEELFDTLINLGYQVYLISSHGELLLLTRTSLSDGNWLAKPIETLNA